MASVWTGWAAGVRPISVSNSARRAGSSTSTWRTPSIVAGICTSWPSMRVVQVVFSSTAVRLPPAGRPPYVSSNSSCVRSGRGFTRGSDQQNQPGWWCSEHSRSANTATAMDPPRPPPARAELQRSRSPGRPADRRVLRQCLGRPHHHRRPADQPPSSRSARADGTSGCRRQPGRLSKQARMLPSTGRGNRPRSVIIRLIALPIPSRSRPSRRTTVVVRRCGFAVEAAVFFATSHAWREVDPARLGAPPPPLCRRPSIGGELGQPPSTARPWPSRFEQGPAHAAAPGAPSAGTRLYGPGSLHRRDREATAPRQAAPVTGPPGRWESHPPSPAGAVR